VFAFLLDHLGIISLATSGGSGPCSWSSRASSTSRLAIAALGEFSDPCWHLQQLNQLGLTHIGWSQFWPMMPDRPRPFCDVGLVSVEF